METRELVIALPLQFIDLDPEELLKTFAEHFKSRYGVEWIVDDGMTGTVRIEGFLRCRCF